MYLRNGGTKMKKLCKALALTLCMIMLLSTITVAGDAAAKTVLTLEEAKKLALENDVQFKLQESYILQKSEDYADMSENFNSNRGVKANTAAGKAAGRINNQVALESANYAVKQEKFNKADLKRESDYNVTKAYYDVMKAKYSLDNVARSLELAKKDLDIAKIKVEHGLTTSSALTQVENAYKTSQTAYNTVVSDLQNYMATISKNIGKALDVSTVDVDMTIGMPDISSIDLNKIKEDNLQNNPTFFAIKKGLDLAKYKQFLVDTEYEDTYDRNQKLNDDIRDEYENMVYKADRDYDDSQYQYDEALKGLDIALKTSYSGIITLKDTIDNLRKSVENARVTFTQNKIRFDLGLISKYEFEKSESALKDLENQLNANIINLNMQYVALTQYSYTPVK
jgi:outer membrane protein TolC